MKNSYRFGVALLIIAAIIAIITYGTNSFRIDYFCNKEQKVIKIGVAIPLTGNQGFVGEGMRNAILLAQKELEVKKPVTKYKYETIFEDVQVDPKAAASAAYKLINIDKVDAIIDAYAPIGNTISPITQQAGVVHISVAFDPRIAKGEYNFIHFTTPDTAARTFLKEMNRRGLKTLGIFRLNNSGILAIYDSVIRLSPEYGIKVVSDKEFQPGERDFKSIIAAAEKNKADIYALLSIPPELDILSKQMSDMNMKNQTSIIYFELSQNKSIYEGFWSIGYGKTSVDLEQNYKNEYKKELTFGVANVYDAFNIIVHSAESYAGEGKPPTVFVANAISNLKGYTGALGELTVDPDGIIDSPVQVKTVKNGILTPDF